MNCEHTDTYKRIGKFDFIVCLNPHKDSGGDYYWYSDWAPVNMKEYKSCLKHLPDHITKRNVLPGELIIHGSNTPSSVEIQTTTCSVENYARKFDISYATARKELESGSLRNGWQKPFPHPGWPLVKILKKGA